MTGFRYALFILFNSYVEAIIYKPSLKQGHFELYSTILHIIHSSYSSPFLVYELFAFSI